MHSSLQHNINNNTKQKPTFEPFKLPIHFTTHPFFYITQENQHTNTMAPTVDSKQIAAMQKGRVKKAKSKKDKKIAAQKRMAVARASRSYLKET